MAGTTKWICPSCTYNNYPSTLHCALCTCAKPADLHPAPRPPGSSIPRHKNKHHLLGVSGLGRLPGFTASSGASFSDMIIDPNNAALRLVPISPLQREGGRGGEQSTHPTSLQSKWVCATCTFGNWPNSNHCSMCGAPKSRHRPGLGVAKEASRTISAGGGGGIGDSILDYAPSPSCGGAVGGGPHLPDDTRSPAHARDSATNRPFKSKNGKKSSTDNRLQKKWKCQKCTYENWSRASKCIMCQSPRLKMPSPPLSDSEISQSSPHPSHSRHFPSSTTSHSSAFPPADNANSSSSFAHIRAAGTNSNEAAPTSLHAEAASPAAVRLIPVVSDTASDTYPSTTLKSNSDEVRQIRNRLSSSDWLFINACLGVLNDDEGAVKAYLRHEGDRARQLSSDECLVLGESSTFSVGSTLVHLAIRFQRSDILGLLLTPAPTEARKRLPSQSNPDLATSIREEVGRCLRQNKGDWKCYFLTHLCTFTLPMEIRRFCVAVQKKLLDGIVDREVEKELEEGAPIINWSSELVEELGSYLYPLWNRTAGDCLLDSVLQATWGVMDRDGTLRRALADSLVDGASLFYKRWKESEQRQAHTQGFSLDEDQLLHDWAAVLALADQKRKSLEQIHIFALAHILRRPVVVYGVKVVKNFRGENLGLANFEGLYLPLIWETSFCNKNPIALAYTRGHFSALVSMPPSQQTNRLGAWSNQSCDNHVTHLPLVDSEGRQLPVHFVSEEEIGCEERLLKQYCECRVTRLGTLTAVQEGGCPHSLVTELVDEWMDRYRRMDKKREATACNYDSDS